jgi:carbon-monoxide dehydrogenase medium subunit
MRGFELVEPRDLGEACAALAELPDAKPIAGGTALVILMKQGLVVTDALVNLAKVEGMAGIEPTPEGGLRIGAMATLEEVASSELVRRDFPLLAEACHLVANIRIRNVATLGGNLAHADYQSDPPTALLALDAEVELTSAGGVRAVALDELVQGAYVTVIRPEEVLSAIHLKPPITGARSRYVKFTTRSSEDRPCAGVAVVARMAGDRCEALRLAVGAAGPRSVRFKQAEAMAEGRRLDRALAESVAESVAADIDVVEDLNGGTGYKRRVVRTLTARALLACAGGRAQ